MTPDEVGKVFMSVFSLCCNFSVATRWRKSAEEHFTSLHFQLSPCFSATWRLVCGSISLFIFEPVLPRRSPLRTQNQTQSWRQRYLREVSAGEISRTGASQGVQDCCQLHLQHCRCGSLGHSLHRPQWRRGTGGSLTGRTTSLAWRMWHWPVKNTNESKSLGNEQSKFDYSNNWDLLRIVHKSLQRERLFKTYLMYVCHSLQTGQCILHYCQCAYTWFVKQASFQKHRERQWTHWIDSFTRTIQQCGWPLLTFVSNFVIIVLEMEIVVTLT